MGELTLTEMGSEVRYGLRGRTDLGDDRILRAINLGILTIGRFADWQELKTFVDINAPVTASPTNDVQLALPSTVRIIHTARWIEGTLSKRLTQIDWPAFDQKYPDPPSAARAKPDCYVRWNNVLILNSPPTTAGVIRLRVTTYPTLFTVDDGESVSNLRDVDEIIIKLATAFLWESFGRIDIATTYRGIAVSQLTALKNISQTPDAILDTTSNETAIPHYAIAMPHGSR